MAKASPKWVNCSISGVREGMIDKAGSWYSFVGENGQEGQRIGQGKESARKFLKDNPEIAADLETRIRAKLTPSAASPTTPETEDKITEVDKTETKTETPGDQGDQGDQGAQGEQGAQIADARITSKKDKKVKPSQESQPVAKKAAG